MSALEIGTVAETSSAVSLPHRGRLVVLAATLAMAMGFGGLGLVSVFMTPMEADLGWTRSNTSLGYAIAATGMAVGGLFWGQVADRVDVRLLLVTGGAGMVASLFVMAIQQSLSTYYIASLIYGGFGFSVLYAPLVSTSGEWFPQQRGLVTGVVTAGGALGQGLLPFAGRFLIEGFGWRLAFAGIGCIMLAILALSLPIIRWPQGTLAPSASATVLGKAHASEYKTVALLALAAFLCCACMGGPLVHMVSFVGSICSPAIGATSLLIAMIFGAIGRVCFGVVADRCGALTSYAMASATQTASVLIFPALGNSLSFMILSAVFGFGFAGNMTSLSLCVRDAVPANRFGGALGAVMMIAWAGMASSSYFSGRLFDITLSYNLSFVVAGITGTLKLMVLALISFRQRRFALFNRLSVAKWVAGRRPASGR
jgi:MFS family permease